MGNLSGRYRDKPLKSPRPSEKMAAGLVEAIAIVKGDADPARVHHAKGGRPRIGDEGKTLAATKPWEALGMSRRTWQRRQKEKRDA